MIHRTLIRAGRVAVVGLVAAGAFVGAGSGLIWLVPFIPFAGVGALLAIRRPRTSIGWILIGLGWSFAILMAPVQATAQQFADGTADLPSAVLAVAQGGGGPAAFFLFALLATVFPSGRLPTGRWGMVGRAALGLGLIIVIAGYVMPVISVNLAGREAYTTVRNPIALLPDLALWRLVTPDDSIFPVMLVMLAAAASVIIRVRRARGTERQQLRWFAASLAFVVAGVGTGFAVGFLLPGSSASGLAWIPAILAFTSVPMAVGIAVFRYRLYDIDRIVSRTISYVIVTGVLGAVFAIVVVGLQAILVSVTKNGGIPIAASTLVVVALLQPLRRRVQRAVDRRFDRARYDADQTVRTFASRLRGNLDLGAVSAEILGTATSAVRPSAASVWLRGNSR
jgi:hypothetical protein